MRVIAGSARSIKLSSPKTDDIRPTTDRIKETLFNIIQQDLFGSMFLDLFAGSGAIGIEALSRGAEKAYFIDNSREAIRIIKENVKKTKFENISAIFNTDYKAALKKLGALKIKFNFIFVDPPYFENMYMDILKNIHDNCVLEEDGLLILELPKTFDIDKDMLCSYNLKLEKEKKYKNNKHLFLRYSYENSSISG